MSEQYLTISQNQDLLNSAVDAIVDLFGDTSVSKEQGVKNLRFLVDTIESMIRETEAEEG